MALVCTKWQGMSTRPPFSMNLPPLWACGRRLRRPTVPGMEALLSLSIPRCSYALALPLALKSGIQRTEGRSLDNVLTLYFTLRIVCTGRTTFRKVITLPGSPGAVLKPSRPLEGPFPVLYNRGTAKMKYKTSVLPGSPEAVPEVHRASYFILNPYCLHLESLLCTSVYIGS